MTNGQAVFKRTKGRSRQGRLIDKTREKTASKWSKLLASTGLFLKTESEKIRSRKLEASITSP
jgi:hypothetical protein